MTARHGRAVPHVDRAIDDRRAGGLDAGKLPSDFALGHESPTSAPTS